MARLYSCCFSNVSVFAISLFFARTLGIHWRPLMLGLVLSFPLISMPGIWTLEHAGIPRPNQASIKSSALTACPCCLTRYHSPANRSCEFHAVLWIIFFGDEHEHEEYRTRLFLYHRGSLQPSLQTFFWLVLQSSPTVVGQERLRGRLRELLGWATLTTRTKRTESARRHHE